MILVYVKVLWTVIKNIWFNNKSRAIDVENYMHRLLIDWKKLDIKKMQQNFKNIKFVCYEIKHDKYSVVTRI